MFQAIRDYFNSDDFMPHGHCFLWQPDILWLHVLSDTGVAAAYFAIPLALLYFIKKRPDLPFGIIFWLFAAFILLCGTTHLMSIWVLWHPDYAIEGIIKAATAIISLATFVVIVRLIPQALLLASPSQLAALNRDLRDANRRLEILYEQNTQSAQGRLRAIVDNALDAVISIDQAGNITEWNRQAETIFGWPYQEAIGKAMAELIIPPEYRNAHHKGMQHFLAHGEGPILNKRLELQALHRNGTIFPIELSVAAHTVGDAYHFTAFVRNITQRQLAEKKIQAAQKYLEDVLNHIPDPIFMKDRQHRWIGGNRAFWELMNGPPERFIGKSDYEFFPKEEADVFWEKDNKVFTSGEVDINEEFFTDSTGHRHVFSTKKVAFLNDEEELFLVGVIHDITGIKETETNLRRYAQALERSNKELDEFAYIASHDLKEPLRGIHNHARFLMEDNEGKLDEESVTRLHRLMYLSQRMERLVSDLLYFSRLGRQDIAIQPTEISAVIRDIENTLDLFLAQRHAHIAIVPPLPIVTCDTLRIAELFRNLITNAVKYNDKAEKTVEIGFRETQSSPQGTTYKNVFYVKDNGKGIAPEFHENIFRIFHRLQPAQEGGEDGTGVGLTFVKRIVERHGGRIWLESEPGKGTTFYFTLTPS